MQRWTERSKSQRFWGEKEGSIHPCTRLQGGSVQMRPRRRRAQGRRPQRRPAKTEAPEIFWRLPMTDGLTEGTIR